MSDINIDPSIISNEARANQAGPSHVTFEKSGAGVKRRATGRASTGQRSRDAQASTSRRIGVGQSGASSQASSTSQSGPIAPVAGAEGSRKRQRRQSPKKAQGRQSLPNASTALSSDLKGKNRADAPLIPAAHLARGVRPYPIGLTPFRYACQHPDHPPPPPGDPNDPRFTRFDPTATGESSSSTTQNNPPDPQTTSQVPQSGQDSSQPSLETDAGMGDTFADLGGGTNDGDAYESLSALLSVSDFQNHLAELEAQGAFAHTELDLGDGQEQT